MHKNDDDKPNKRRDKIKLASNSFVTFPGRKVD